MPVPSFYRSTFTLVWGALFTALLVAACVYDIRYRRIPNLIVATTTACGFLYSVLIDGGSGATASALGTILGLALWVPFYALRWIGAGDVKLFAAAGAWLWPTHTLEAAVLAAGAGALLSLLWMLRSYGIRGTGIDLSVAITAPRRGVRLSAADARRVLPYGVALTIGALGVGWFPGTIRSVIDAAH